MNAIRFGTAGWRGVIGDDFTFENVAVVAQAIATYLKKAGKTDKGVVIGYDTHGLGYSAINSKTNGIAGEIIYFTPPDSPCEVWLVKIRNEGETQRNLSLYGFAKWLMGDFFMEKQFPNIMRLYMRADYDVDLNAIVATQVQNSSREIESYGFLATDLRVDGYDCRKEDFYGRYGDIARPTVLEMGKCLNTDLCGEDAVAVLQHNVTLEAEEELEFKFILGCAETSGRIGELVSQFKNTDSSRDALEKVKARWREVLARCTVRTPDSGLDLMTNIWGQYQMVNIARWRSASHHRPGEGGYGYRDTAQDIEGVLTVDSDMAREKLMKILYYQYNDGHAVSGFSDMEGPWENQGKGMVLGKSDVGIWMPFDVVAYVKETGDYNLLQEEVDFFNGGKATVYEHALRTVDFTYQNRGERGFPLLGHADWNDAFDACGKEGKGESVWLAMALCRAMKQMIELAGHIEDDDTGTRLQREYDEISGIINDDGWDGEWYRRLFNDHGDVVGSSECAEAKMFLNPQSWSVMSGVAEDERAATCMAKVDKLLGTEVGPAMFAPAYTKYDPEIGRISAFAPGTKENAAVFSHVAAFKVVADCMLGRGDEAYSTFTQILPLGQARAGKIERYRVEPYVYAEYCFGPEHPHHFGRGAFTWQTGTTPWMFAAATEWILGARRDFDGLRIDPCIPSSWPECSITRPFRGAVYEIHIENPQGVNKGVKCVTVDGDAIAGNLITPHNDGKHHEVRAIMG